MDSKSLMDINTFYYDAIIYIMYGNQVAWCIALHTWYILLRDSLGRYCLSRACFDWLMYSVKPVTNSSLVIIWSPFRSKTFNMSVICSSLIFVSFNFVPNNNSFTSEANKSLPPRWLISWYSLLVKYYRLSTQ